MKAFLLTARHQSFSRAAEQLYITQSGMSVLIRELEEQLGFRLFDRTTRRVTLTEFGNRFLPIADRSLVELESAAQNIGRSATAANRRLMLGAMPLIAGNLMPAAIAEYAKRDPGLDIELHDGERSRLVAMVSAGELDAALGCFIDPVPGLRRIPMHRFCLMAIQSQAEALRTGRPLRWEDLVEARLLGGPADSPVQQLIERHLQRLGRQDPPDLVFNYMETIIAMVAAGAGVAVIPSFAISVCRSHRIAMSPLQDPLVPIELYAMIDRGRKLPHGAAEFNEFLKGYVAQWADQWADQPSPPGLAQAA
ncbi:MAG TPA: LysR family transcriptional regulator [Burkholderiales bacterium]|nr:LysR family transcriptional regulator [Burkholderiales bacterium]